MNIKPGQLDICVYDRKSNMEEPPRGRGRPRGNHTQNIENIQNGNKEEDRWAQLKQQKQ